MFYRKFGIHPEKIVRYSGINEISPFISMIVIKHFIYYDSSFNLYVLKCQAVLIKM